MYSISPLQVPTNYRLPVEYAAGIVLLFALIYVIHLARRGFRQPSRTGGVATGEFAGGKVEAFDFVQRVFHWTLFIVLGLLTLTGVSLFVPGYFDFLLGAFGIFGYSGNLLWHIDMVWVLLAIIVIHTVWDVFKAKGWSNIWVGMKDIRDVAARLKNFLGVSKEYPKHGKYDIFMKTFHWGLTLSLVLLGISGIYLWNPYNLFPMLAPSIEYIFRLLHDIFAFLAIGLMIGHIYFALLPINWPELKAIFTGTIDSEVYYKEFDTGRWPLTRETGKAGTAETGHVAAVAERRRGD